MIPAVVPSPNVQLTVWQLPSAVNVQEAVSSIKAIPIAAANALTAVREQRPAANVCLNAKNIEVGT